MNTRRFTLKELVLVVVAILVAGWFILPMFSRPCERARRVNCAGNLKQIGLGCLIYSDANNHFFPNLNPNGGSNFEPLNTGGILHNSRVYACPMACVERTMAADTNYLYFGSGLKDDQENAAGIRLAYDQSGNHPEIRKWLGLAVDEPEWINVLFADANVEGAKPDGSKTWNKYP